MMRNAFTMIEMIFVIITIGILAIVGIPKLISERDNAAAKVCKNEAAGLLQELTGYYAKNGYFDTVDNMSSLPVGIAATAGNGENGISDSSGTVPATGSGITYVCNGEAIVTYTPTQSSYTDSQGNVHDQFGIVTADPGGQTTVQAKITATDFTNKNFYKSSPGYVIGGK